MNSRDAQERCLPTYLTAASMPSCCTDERLSFLTSASVADSNRKGSYENVEKSA